MGRTIFYNVSGGGHVIATYGIVSELVARGEEVIYYEAPWFQQEIEALGAEFRPYPEIRPYTGPLARSSFHHEMDLPVVLTWSALEWIPQLLEPARAARPDYIVHDSMCVWGRVIAQLLDVPAYASVHIPAVSWPLVLRHGSYWRDLPMMVARSFQSVRAFRRLERQLRTTYGIPPTTLIDTITNRQPINICHAPRELQPMDGLFDDTYHFVGSVHTRPPQEHGFPLERLRDPLVYIGFGTICDPGVEFFRNCVRAFADLEVQVVMVLSRSTTVADLGDIPRNMIVWSLTEDGMAPQMEILSRATVFLMNGGNGGAREGGWFGVPLIAVPPTFETEMISKRIAQQGAGIHIPLARATPQRLRQAVETIVANPTPFRENSARIGDACRRSGGGVAAAEAILKDVDARRR